jgi:hypothetical protein
VYVWIEVHRSFIQLKSFGKLAITDNYTYVYVVMGIVRRNKLRFMFATTPDLNEGLSDVIEFSSECVCCVQSCKLKIMNCLQESVLLDRKCGIFRLRGEAAGMSE